MKNMTEIRKMQTADIAKQTTSLRVEIAEMKRRLHVGETSNVREIRNKRKTLARMLTVMSEQIAKEKI
jgi:ribosomal protein L29